MRKNRGGNKPGRSGSIPRGGVVEFLLVALTLTAIGVFVIPWIGIAFIGTGSPNAMYFVVGAYVFVSLLILLKVFGGKQTQVGDEEV